MLTKNQFEVLYAVFKNPGCTQRDAAAAAGLSLGSVSATLKMLCDLEFLNKETMVVTEVGKKDLGPIRLIMQ